MLSKIASSMSVISSLNGSALTGSLRCLSASNSFLRRRSASGSPTLDPGGRFMGRGASPLKAPAPAPAPTICCTDFACNFAELT